MSSRRSRGGLQRSTSNRTRPRLPPLASSSHSRRFGGWFHPLLCSPGSCRPRTWCGAAPPPAGSTSGGSALDPRPPGHPAPSSQAGGGFWRGVSREGKPVLKQHGSPRLLRRPFSYRGCARRGQRPRPARLGSARHGCLQPATRGAGTGGGRAGPGWGEGLRRPPAIKCEQEPRSEPRGKGGGGGWEPPAADRPPPPAPLRGWRGAHWRSQPAPRCPPGWGTRRGAAPGGAVPEGVSSPYPPGPSLQAGGTPAPPLGPQMLSPAPPKCSPLPPAFAARPADLAQRGGSARSWGSLLGRGSLGFYRCPGARVGLGFLSLTCFSLLQSPGRW